MPSYSFESKPFADNTLSWLLGLEVTLSQPITTKTPYANNLDPDETSSNSASHPDQSCLKLRQHFHKHQATLQHFQNWSRHEILTNNDLFSGLRIKDMVAAITRQWAHVQSSPFPCPLLSSSISPLSVPISRFTPETQHLQTRYRVISEKGGN